MQRCVCVSMDIHSPGREHGTRLAMEAHAREEKQTVPMGESKRGDKGVLILTKKVLPLQPL